VAFVNRLCDETAANIVEFLFNKLLSTIAVFYGAFGCSVVQHELEIVILYTYSV